MREWARTIRGVLLFDTATYTRLRDSADRVLRGLLVILAVALIAGLPALVLDVADGLSRPPAAESEAADGAAEMTEALQQIEPFLQNLPPAQREQVLEQVRQNFELGLRIGTRITNLPTILPRPTIAVLQAAGEWFSRPLVGPFLPLTAATLSTWLGYGIWVMLSAKLLGGRGTIPAFFGTTAVFAVPHLLDVFQPVRVLGPIMGVIATLWGMAIFVKATAVSHEISIGRALAAAVLPLLVAILLLSLAAFAFIGVIALAASF